MFEIEISVKVYLNPEVMNNILSLKGRLYYSF